MEKILIISFIAVIAFSCATPKHPENVNNVLELADKNKAELEKVFDNYKNAEDSLKLQAAYFLIGNMGNKHSYVSFVLVDSSENVLPFDVLEYENYNKLLDAWDTLETQYGPIHFMRDKYIKDYETITSDYLIQNIDLAFEAWKRPWTKHLNFNQFCEYILPYRGSNEPLEEWRTHFLKENAWLIDSMGNSTDPVKACALINNDIRSWFSFDERYYEHPTDQGLSEVLKTKMGRCEDMTNLAIFAMRSWGIPVMSDYTPYWANTGNNHAWNAILGEDGKTIIFMGGEANPYEYNLRAIKAKVYRKTYAKQSDCLMEIKKDWVKVPPYLNSNTQADVTKEYVDVTDVKMKLTKARPDSTEFAYICVFNSGKWKAINWSYIGDNLEVNFKDMGRGIAYLPAYYKDSKIIPAGEQFILENSEEIKFITADTANTTQIEISVTTKRSSGLTTDDIAQAKLESQKKYELFYWDYEWKRIANKPADNGVLKFDDVPENALLWMVKENSRKEERIFTIGSEGEQIWW